MQKAFRKNMTHEIILRYTASINNRYSHTSDLRLKLSLIIHKYERGIINFSKVNWFNFSMY